MKITRLLSQEPPEILQREAAPSTKEFQKIVLDHYRKSGRDLAWRRTSNPYHILVSEIMLQQTQVGRVAKKYPEFIEAFPDFPSLAAAPLSGILAAWQGMGYNRRAISLQKCARNVIEEHGGELPQEPEILATFPGIGKATAASICAFAFNIPVVFIETNIRRVFIHFFFTGDGLVSDADILPLVRSTLYRKDPRTWYWALMDLGSVLKKTTINPNRRSTQYVRQPAFRGSDREIRGKIIKALLQNPVLDREELIRKTGTGRERARSIISALEKEGFLTDTRDGITIITR